MFQFLLTLLSFLACAAAAPVTTNMAQDPLGYQVGGGVVGFVVLVLDIIVWIELLKSNRDVLPKVLWALLVFVFPVVGVILYFLFSNRKAHSSGYEVIP